MHCGYKSAGLLRERRILTVAERLKGAIFGDVRVDVLGLVWMDFP